MDENRTISWIGSWFNMSINNECGKLIESNITPRKLFLKYQPKEIMVKYMTPYCHLDVIYDPDMDCLLRVE